MAKERKDITDNGKVAQAKEKESGKKDLITTDHQAKALEKD